MTLDSLLSISSLALLAFSASSLACSNWRFSSSLLSIDVSESESDSSVVVMWNCELSLQFSFRSSSPLLFVFEGGNWYLDWYADFDFMMLVCKDFGFIFGAVVSVLSRFLSRKPDFVPQCLGYPHKPDQVHLTMLCVAFFLENLFAISDIPNFASRPDPVSRLVNSLTPHTKLCKILLTRTVDLVSGELYRQPWFGFYTSPRQAFASLTWNFLSRI
jgi:hypothetical protein